MKSATERVRDARALADVGDHEGAAELLYGLAVEDRTGDIGYAERMRWHETVGVIERARFHLRGWFTARKAA